jgi:hypothetical protein
VRAVGVSVRSSTGETGAFRTTRDLRKEVEIMECLGATYSTILNDADLWHGLIREADRSHRSA